MYTPRTQPFEHQTRALSAGRGREGFAYLMEMGTGKTKVLIDEAGELHSEGRITGLLIIAPKGVCGNWIRELLAHIGCSHTAVVWQSSPSKSVHKEIRDSLLRVEDTLRVVIMNVEAFGAGTKAPQYAEEFLRAHDAMLGVDESQTIKNPAVRRTKSIMRLGPLARYRRVMTGTPAPNSPMDLYSQLEFISPGATRQRSYYGFRSRYAVLQEKMYGGRRVKIEVGYRNLEELQSLVSQHSFRVRKDECLDLPDKTYMQWDVELTPEQRRMYQQMTTEALVGIGGETFASSSAAITTLIRLQQIVCGYIRDDDGDLHHIDSERVRTVLDICESSDQDTIIWVGQHTPMIPVLQTALEERFGSGCVARFWGGNAQTREEEARMFVESPTTRFMISTQAAGGRGNTWTNAKQVIYFANTYNLEERMQSEDRCHRAGQTSRVVYHDLAAQGVAIDTRLTRALRAKESISAQLVGEAAREWI